MKDRLQMSSEMVRLDEFAVRFRIRPRTARQWVRRRKVASCKVGKLLLIPTSEISRLVEENTRPHADGVNPEAA